MYKHAFTEREKERGGHIGTTNSFDTANVQSQYTTLDYVTGDIARQSYNHLISSLHLKHIHPSVDLTTFLSLASLWLSNHIILARIPSERAAQLLRGSLYRLSVCDALDFACE